MVHNEKNQSVKNPISAELLHNVLRLLITFVFFMFKKLRSGLYKIFVKG